MVIMTRKMVAVRFRNHECNDVSIPIVADNMRLNNIFATAAADIMMMMTFIHCDDEG